MYNEVNQIYKMLYSHMVTPYNLLENVRLPNYSYIKYYRGDNGIIAEMQCFVEDEGESIFYYHFDKEDKLFKVLMNNGNSTSTVFEREKELQKALQRYHLKKNKNIDTAI